MAEGGANAANVKTSSSKSNCSKGISSSSLNSTGFPTMNTSYDEARCENVHPSASNEYKTANDYANAVRQWMRQYQNFQMWNQMNWFYMTMPMYATCCMPGSWPGQQSSPGFPAAGMPGSTSPQPSSRPATPATNRQVRQPRTRSQEFRIPSLWKRVAAELIDFFLMFIIKFAVTVFIVEHLGLIDMEKHDFTVLLRNDLDYNVAWSMTTELVAMEVVNRIFITFSETMCLRRGLGNGVGGSTPGKGIMGLKVILCEDIVDLPGNKVRVTPATDIGFCNALIRSTIKNFSLTFFFPVCFTVYFFQHNRAAYDIIASTIVVDASEDEIWPAR